MEKGMSWSALNILRVVKSNPRKGKHPYCCTMLQMPVKDYVTQRVFLKVALVTGSSQIRLPGVAW